MTAGRAGGPVVVGVVVLLLGRALPLPGGMATWSAGAPSPSVLAASAPLQGGLVMGPPAQVAGDTLAAIDTPYADAQPLLDLLRTELLPPDLVTQEVERQRRWSDWVRQRDRDIRRRLVAGYEDSMVNLLFFGTRFTTRPRVRSGDVPTLDARALGRPAIQGRLDDFIAGVTSPGSDDRLRFAREVIGGQGLDVSTDDGRRGARAYLLRIVARVVEDQLRYDASRALLKAGGDPAGPFIGRSTIFRDRGLSSDTSLFASFALQEALTRIRAAGLLEPGSVRRMAIVGPGLDVSDKEEGYDFYPPQTIQPFAVIDSLIRLGLADASRVRATTLDVSPRVNQHVTAARLRAAAGEDYIVHVPRSTNEAWAPALVEYWEAFGTMVGRRATPFVAPSNAGGVDVRATRIRPDVVLRVAPMDMNLILQRLSPQAPDERFDLIVATNMLLYYGVFEQALALANAASMLRPGGLFLSNDFVLPTASMGLAGYTDVPYTDAGDGDRIWWYERR